MLHKFDDNPLSRFGVVMVRTQMQNSNVKEGRKPEYGMQDFY